MSFAANSGVLPAPGWQDLALREGWAQTPGSTTWGGRWRKRQFLAKRGGRNLPESTHEAHSHRYMSMDITDVHTNTHAHSRMHPQTHLPTPPCTEACTLLAHMCIYLCPPASEGPDLGGGDLPPCPSWPSAGPEPKGDSTQALCTSGSGLSNGIY